jgi:hypothetical protein
MTMKKPNAKPENEQKAELKPQPIAVGKRSPCLDCDYRLKTKDTEPCIGCKDAYIYDLSIRGDGVSTVEPCTVYRVAIRTIAAEDMVLNGLGGRPFKVNLTTEDISAIKKQRVQGLSISKLGKMFGITKGRVIKVLKGEGCYTRMPQKGIPRGGSQKVIPTDKEKKMILSLRSSGYSLERIYEKLKHQYINEGKRCGVSRATITEIIKAQQNCKPLQGRRRRTWKENIAAEKKALDTVAWRKSCDKPDCQEK